MNFSAGGVIWAASSAMFSTKGICIPSAFSIFGRASSKACVQPPSFLALKYRKATFGGALSVNPSAQADPVANRAGVPATRANLLNIVFLPLASAGGLLPAATQLRLQYHLSELRLRHAPTLTGHPPGINAIKNISSYSKRPYPRLGRHCRQPDA